MLRKLLATALLCFAGMVGNANAQSLNLIKVTSCGSGDYNVPFLTVDATGTLCTAASVSASISGFAPATTGTPITATTGGVTGSLPAGAVVVATNVGTTNGAYCKLGASATTSDQYIAPHGGWFAFTVGANTQLTCITSSSTTTVNMVGGSGLPTGTGGGGGGSGGGGGTSSAFDAAFPANGTAIGISDGTNMKAWLAAIALADGVNGNNTAAVASWLWNGSTYDRARGSTSGAFSIIRDAAGNARGANVDASNRLTTAPTMVSGSVASGAYASGSIASGAMVDLGSQADAACGTDTGTCSAIALIKRGNQNATSINTNVQASIPAGSNSIGTVGADPSKGGATPASVAINVSTATTTQLVALSGTTKIYVTSFDVIAGGTGNITFVYGTGSNCGTGTTSLTGAYNLTAQAGIAKGNGVGAVLVVPAGNALCVTTSAAVQMSGSVSYQQF